MDKVLRLDFISNLLSLIHSSGWRSYFVPFLEELKTADLSSLVEKDSEKLRGRIQLNNDLQSLENYLEKEKERLEKAGA